MHRSHAQAIMISTNTGFRAKVDMIEAVPTIFFQGCPTLMLAAAHLSSGWG